MSKKNANIIDIEKDVVNLSYEHTKKHLNAKWADIEKKVLYLITNTHQLTNGFKQ